MSLTSIILKQSVAIKSLGSEEKNINHIRLQRVALKKLLRKATFTEFGSQFGFENILNSKNVEQTFGEQIPVFDYAHIYKDWWSKSFEGKRNVCWPGKVSHFVFTSGTTESSSKRIPATSALLRSIKHVAIRQYVTLHNYPVANDYYEKDILMLGGSASLDSKKNLLDLSGLLMLKLPFWLNHFYKPGIEIAKETDWDKMIEKIIDKAPEWDVGTLMGIPSWMQILLERIVDKYKLKNIHEIWPNLAVYFYGGVPLDPYKKNFSKLVGKKMFYINTYLASEGFIAFQATPEKHELQLATDGGIYFEFIPFNEKNFSADGNLLEHPETLTWSEIEENVDYALLISTCAGAWRYLLGDTIKFTSCLKAEIIITGRTKHFINLCSEHLSVGNMEKAIELATEKFGISFKEFSVAGIPYQNLFAHKWYIGTDDKVDPELLKKNIDDSLRKLNDDYNYERGTALKEIFVEVLSPSIFYEWMKKNGKQGGQYKFPRVLKNEQLKDWENFISRKITASSAKQ